ncbi:metallophosphoesterase [Bacillus sp. HMF5848]|uniref:metallophosphoesterase family protein n=1 Tax=Bacillus sp. HMF5848 TaxID=2495421 RepID=UPI000F79BCA6|nr:metallophosphoesterase family protein [Bacillus sp. HMF5848]RSK27281.1 metallophosphoesterase [Bacillus sp. HMF5848]
MRIIVVADTHMPKMAKSLPKELIDDLKACDLILHCGDWQTIDVYHLFKQYGPVEGVHGNVDDEQLTKHLPLKQVISVGGFRIGIKHGHGSSSTTEKRVLKAFQSDELDIILFGHSHIPVCKYVNNMLLINPGSPTNKRKQPQFSHAILRIDKSIRCFHRFYN